MKRWSIARIAYEYSDENMIDDSKVGHLEDSCSEIPDVQYVIPNRKYWVSQRNSAPV